MVDIGLTGLQIYLVCHDEGYTQTIINAVTSMNGQLSMCHFHQSTTNFNNKRDLNEIKKKILQSDAVIAVISPKFMSSKQMQYELALAQDMKKDIIVLRDAVDLPKEFYVSPVIDVTISETQNVAEVLRTKISQGLLSKEGTRLQVFLFV